MQTTYYLSRRQIDLTCSRTSSLGEARSFTNIGTAPLSITTLVFSDVPEAMFVRAHAASNYMYKQHPGVIIIH